MISVCMATYNGAKTVRRQLESILMQLSAGDEVVIVDDQSKDDTIKIIKSIAKESTISISININEKNRGPVKSFEYAMELASGDYIFFSDQDDIWLENKVSLVMDAFQENADLIIHDGIVVDAKLKIIDESWNRYNGNNLRQGIFGNIIKNGYTGAMMAVSSKLAKKVLPFPQKIPMHDQWIFDVAKIKKMKISIIEQPLIQYVRHGNNATGMVRRKNSEMFKDRFNLIRELIKFKVRN